jgi:hypothetical protein
MFRIQRFNILKTSSVVALMYMVIVGIIFVPILVIGLVVGVAASGNDPAGSTLAGLLVASVAAISVYGILGWVVTAIACAIYNLVAGWVGGIEVSVEAVTPPAPPPAWLSPTTPSGAPPSDTLARD